jgi:hypothetical protein
MRTNRPRIYAASGLVLAALGLRSTAASRSVRVVPPPPAKSPLSSRLRPLSRRACHSAPSRPAECHSR